MLDQKVCFLSFHIFLLLMIQLIFFLAMFLFLAIFSLPYHWCFLRQSSTNPGIKKALLTKLRKGTGYSFAKCNEALKQCNNNLQEAELWLHEQAEKEGWSKAQKLQTRSTSQGLVGILAEDNYVAIVEVRIY